MENKSKIITKSTGRSLLSLLLILVMGCTFSLVTVQVAKATNATETADIDSMSNIEQVPELKQLDVELDDELADELDDNFLPDVSEEVLDEFNFEPQIAEPAELSDIAVQPQADSNGIEVIGTSAAISGENALCATKGNLWQYDIATNALTINLDNIATAYSSVNTVVIISNSPNDDFTSSTYSCRNTITSLRFTQTSSNISGLTIQNFAFYQNTTNGSTALTSVTFPDGLQNLSIGNSAFYQYASSGSTALTSVTFPDGLQNLSIGNYAFTSTVLSTFLFKTSVPPGSGAGTVSLGISITCLGIGSCLATNYEASSEELPWTWYGVAGHTNNLWGNHLTADSSNYLLFNDYNQAEDANGISLFTTSTTNDTAFIWGSNKLCQTVGNLWEHNPITKGLTINLDNIANAYTTVNTVEIYGTATKSCRDSNTSLVITKTNINITRLSIGNSAFSQSAVGGGSNALASVTFPDGLQNLSIGNSAFTSTVLSTFLFKTSVPPGSGAGTISLGSSVTRPRFAWTWYGTDGTTANRWGSIILKQTVIPTSSSTLTHQPLNKNKWLSTLLV